MLAHRRRRPGRAFRAGDPDRRRDHPHAAAIGTFVVDEIAPLADERIVERLGDVQHRCDRHRAFQAPDPVARGLLHQLRVVIVGHVDHGKSTLIGRLLYDTNSLPEGKAEEIEAICKRRGTDVVEWSFVLDAFQAERDQAITIDSTQIWFSTDHRDYVIIDAPGHREFLKNMISGAAAADAAILVVDGSEGVQEQTRRHAYLLHLLGLQQIAVVVNKMDMVKHDPEAFENVSREVRDYLHSIGVTPRFIIPISARHGDMIAGRGDSMDWYSGKTLIEVLDSFENATLPVSRPLRFPVQDVYRFQEKRIIVGRVESGILRKGDRLMFSPGNEEATVTSIEVWPEDKDKVEARPGEAANCDDLPIVTVLPCPTKR